ncbi:hypothetical protein LINPERHAP1_LOCUS8551 [Linum perenne]
MTPPEMIIISDDSSDESDTYNPKWDDHQYMNSIMSKSKLARYILDQRLPMVEVLIDHDEVKCDRKSLLTLFDDVVVDPVVITNLAYQRTELTIRMGLEKEISCFLPANLHELARNQGLTPPQAFKDHEFTFLSTAYECDKIILYFYQCSTMSIGIWS